jgi:DNA-binding NarL/FixJ family response regulator
LTRLTGRDNTDGMEPKTYSGARVLVVEDDQDCRALILSLLGRVGCPIREAATGTEALEIAETFRPNVVILDVDIPGITGYEVCHELRKRFGSELGVIFLSGSRVDALDRVAGLLIGADDYIVKPFDPDELVARVRSHIRKHERGVTEANGDASLGRLTRRENEVLELLVQGLDQKQIALQLVISAKTVATHIQRVLSKLGVHSRAQAVAFARREVPEAGIQTNGTVTRPSRPQKYTRRSQSRRKGDPKVTGS